MSTRGTASQFVTDAIGQRHVLADGPHRIVSLVPSITELLFDLGLASEVVGRTSYCVHPAARITRAPSVGGTKKVKMGCLAALRPTHVIVNVDENRKAMADAIADLGASVVVTHPRAPEDNVALFELVGRLFQRQREASELTRRFQARLEHTRRRASALPRRRVLYLIWRKPWMTVSRDTYVSRMLRVVGWLSHPARSPRRYPELDSNVVNPRAIDRVAFSTEPYAFRPEEMEIFSHEFGIPMTRMISIDGELVSWYGSRALRGLDYLLQIAERA